MTVEYDKKSFYQIVRELGKEIPSNLAVYYQGTRFTYKRLDKLVVKRARFLEKKLGLKHGDTVTIALPNIPDVIILILACNRLGIICNMVHPFTPFNQLKAMMDKVGSKYAFLFEQRVAKEVAKYKHLRDTIFVCRVEDYLPIFKRLAYHIFMNFRIRRKLGKSWNFLGFHYLHHIHLKRTFEPAFVKDNPEECAFLLHSGSTTGEPKTIMVSNKNINFVSTNGVEKACCTQEELTGMGMLSFLPSFHGFGLGMTMTTPLLNKMSVILIPKFSPKAVVKAMRFVNVNIICGVPSAYESLVNAPEFVNCPQVRKLHVAWSGGDAMSTVLQQKWRDVMHKYGGHCELYEGFGLTESVAAIALNTDEHHKDNCLGYPISGATIDIFKEDGSKAKPGEIGEIAVNSPSNMIGYFGDEEATKKAVRNGYVFTGDLGYKDEDGFLFFSSRKKRVVKVSGVAVFPSEIEHLVEHIYGVKGVCAISIPDARLKHAIKLLIVTEMYDKEALRQEIIETCQKFLIRWAVPKEIEFIDTLPLTPLNKVDFKKLQEIEDKKRGL